MSIFAAFLFFLFYGCHNACENHHDSTDSINVINNVDIGANWDCSTEFAEDCTADYKRFITRAKEHARPIEPDRLEEKIQALVTTSEHPTARTLPIDELSALLVDQLNISFLLDQIDQRPLKATTVRIGQHEGYTEKEILFNDPFVGKFKGTLLLPKKNEAIPGIIALPGHVMNAKGFIDTYNGKKLAQSGIAMLAITMRGMGMGEAEKNITRELLLNGFTFAGIQVYETLLGLKYLKSIDKVDSQNIGLYGHSGGCPIIQLTVLIEKGFKCAVCDFKAGYIFEGHNLVPNLVPYRIQIEKTSANKVPFLFEPYSHSHSIERVIGFLRNNFRPN